MAILGNILGGVIFVVVILWLLITIGSFFTAWISLALILFQARLVGRLSKRGEITLVEKFSKSYDSLGETFISERYQKRRRLLAVSASIFGFNADRDRCHAGGQEDACMRLWRIMNYHIVVAEGSGLLAIKPLTRRQ